MKLKQWAQDWFAAWQASHAGSYRTAQSYQGLLQNTILPRLGRFELTELTPSRLKRYFAGLPGGKAKNTYKLLRTILQQGVTAGLLAENPCTPEILGEEVLARRKAGPSREQPVFTREEQEKLLAVCEEELWGNLIRFAFATGLPQGELLALREEDVDLAASRLTVRNRIARIADEQSKEHKTRLALLPVPPYSAPLPAACKSIVKSQLGALRTLQAVDARCNPDHLLFATPDGLPVEANVLREHLALLERRAGVPCLTFSTIRETAICLPAVHLPQAALPGLPGGAAPAGPGGKRLLCRQPLGSGGGHLQRGGVFPLCAAPAAAGDAAACLTDEKIVSFGGERMRTG